MTIHGRNLIVTAGGTAVAAAKSCTINVKSDTIEVGSPDSGLWKTYLPTRKGWTVDVSGLLLAGEEELPARLRELNAWVGSTMDISVTVRTDSSNYSGILPFDGMVYSVTTQNTGLVQQPEAIYWDDDKAKFVARRVSLYFDTWSGGNAYMYPAVGAYFTDGEWVYQYDGNTLQYIAQYGGISGKAICTDIKATGSVGSLATYSAKFLGTGALE